MRAMHGLVAFDCCQHKEAINRKLDPEMRPSPRTLEVTSVRSAREL